MAEKSTESNPVKLILNISWEEACRVHLMALGNPKLEAWEQREEEKNIINVGRTFDWVLNQLCSGKLTLEKLRELV